MIINDKARKGRLLFETPSAFIKKNKSRKPVIKITQPIIAMIDDKRGENNLASIDIQMPPFLICHFNIISGWSWNEPVIRGCGRIDQV
jgi:hypothetical protein